MFYNTCLLVAGFSLNCAIFAIVSYVVYFSLIIVSKRVKYRHLPGPRVSGFSGFFFGSLKEAIRSMENGKMYPIFVEECFNKYGPVFMLQLYDRFVVYTNEPDIIKKGLLDYDFPKFSKIYKAVAYPFSIRFLGRGMLAETKKEIWRKHRKLFQPGFEKKIIVGFISEIDSKVNKLIDRMRLHAYENKSFKLNDEIYSTVLEIIADITFGVNLDSLSEEMRTNFKNSIEQILGGLSENFKDPLINYKPHKRRIIDNFKRSVCFLRDFGKQNILNRLKELENDEYTPKDILSVILSKQNEANNEICSEDFVEELVDDFISFFIAGLETTTDALVFTFWELSRNPEVLHRVQTEIEEKLGSKTMIEKEDLINLDYIGMVFKEALRLWPSIPSINRITVEDINIKGYIIPKNTEISFSTYAIHRNSELYEDPCQFKPERFSLNSSTNKTSIYPYTYLPFSLGPRSCIGQNLVMKEAKIIISKIFQNFEINLEPAQNFEVEYNMNLRLKKGIFCKLKLRN